MNSIKKGLYILHLVFLVAACSDSKNQNKEDSLAVVQEDISEIQPQEEELEPGVRALIECYPDFIVDFKDGNIIFADGEEMIFDDGKEKGFTDLLDNSSLKDMFYVAYEVPDSVPGYLNDAGRSRNEKLFKKMYGATPGEVEKKLVKVDWFGQKLPFTSINGGSEQLKKVAAELSEHPELRKYLKSAGTYYWRNVRGANRLSAHSYGIAIDIGVDHSDYWLWKYPGVKEEGKIGYQNRIPKEIVDIFQKYGFIWGGSWYHFDTMHFEYRPEIIRYAELSKKD